MSSLLDIYMKLVLFSGIRLSVIIQALLSYPIKNQFHQHIDNTWTDNLSGILHTQPRFVDFSALRIALIDNG